MSLQTPREFMTEFIEIYRSFPCLWLVNSDEYSDKYKKEVGYKALIQKYRQFDPSASRYTVLRKINGLRTVYKKELLKVKNSMKTSLVADDVYKPSLWYFDLLNFLDFQSDTRNTIDVGIEETQQDADRNQDDSESTNQNHFNQREINTIPNLPKSGDNGSTKSLSAWRPKRKNNLTQEDDVIQMVGQQLKFNCPNDEFEAFGKYVTHKLRTFSKNQAALARKLFNDVIFEAEAEALTKDFKLTNSTNSKPRHSYENDDYELFDSQLYTQKPYSPPYVPQIADHQFSFSPIPDSQHYDLCSSNDVQELNTILPNSETQNFQPFKCNTPELYDLILPNIQSDELDQLDFQQPDTQQPESPQPETELPTHSNYISSSSNVNSPAQWSSTQWSPIQWSPNQWSPTQSMEDNIATYFSNFSDEQDISM